MPINNRGNLFGGRTQQSRGGTHGRGVKQYQRGGINKRRSGQTVNCRNMNYNQCYSHLQNFINEYGGGSDLNTFNKWFNALGNNGYDQVKEGADLTTQVGLTIQRQRDVKWTIPRCNCPGGANGIGSCNSICCGTVQGPATPDPVSGEFASQTLFGCSLAF